MLGTLALTIIIGSLLALYINKCLLKSNKEQYKLAIDQRRLQYTKNYKNNNYLYTQNNHNLNTQIGGGGNGYGTMNNHNITQQQQQQQQQQTQKQTPVPKKYETPESIMEMGYKIYNRNSFIMIYISGVLSLLCGIAMLLPIFMELKNYGNVGFEKYGIFKYSIYILCQTPMYYSGIWLWAFLIPLYVSASSNGLNSPPSEGINPICVCICVCVCVFVALLCFFFVYVFLACFTDYATCGVIFVFVFEKKTI